MLNIEREILDRLGFDFEQALQQFTHQKQEHAFTIDVPAPTAHPLVEAAYAAGGFEVIEPPPQPEQPAPAPPTANPLSKDDAISRLNKLQGKTVGTQLDEIRALLSQFFESMPG